ncbi:unnamed protein product [Musa acuminata subsp. burmannicoides]
MKILHQAISDGTTIKTNSLRTGAGLSIHARAVRKEVSLLPIAAKKIPRLARVLGPVDVSECDSVDREGCADDLVGEEKGAERRGARRQSAFIFLEPHRPVRSCSTQKQR